MARGDSLEPLSQSHQELKARLIDQLINPRKKKQVIVGNEAERKGRKGERG